MSRLSACLVFVLLAASCSGTDDAASDPVQEEVAGPVVVTEPPVETTVAETTEAPVETIETTEPPDATSAPATFDGPSTPEDLVGRWAHYDVVAYEDSALKTVIISYGYNDFSIGDDGVLVDQASFCSSEQRTDQPIETGLSDAATRAIQPPPTEVAVEVTDGVLSLSRPFSPTPVGIELGDPFNESLPTDPNDPRIVDSDGDGNPGITVTIKVSDAISGELYIARREIFSYEGTLVGPDRIEGVVIDESEQLVIGASQPMFNVERTDWGQHPDPNKSPMLLVRVDESWDCDRLAAERDAIFPPSPDVDW